MATLAFFETQVLFSTAVTGSCATSSNLTSDTITFDVDTVMAQVSVKVDFSATPAAGDVMDIYLKRTSGDPDADPDSADEYDSDLMGLPIMSIDGTVSDPGVMTRDIPVATVTGKLFFVNQSATNSATVSAQIAGKTIA